MSVINDLVKTSNKPNLYYDNGEWKLCAGSEYSEITNNNKSLTIRAYKTNREYIKGKISSEKEVLKSEKILNKLSDFNVYKYENNKCEIPSFEKVKLYKDSGNLKLCPGIEGKLEDQEYFFSYGEDYTGYTFNGIYLDQDSVELKNSALECNIAHVAHEA